jgi:hypothetical protein
MKKVRNSTNDEMHAAYKRSDFKKLKRDKFYEKMITRSNVVVLEPKIARAFPTSAIVNRTLSNLLDLAKKSTRLKSRSTRSRGKVARAG